MLEISGIPRQKMRTSQNCSIASKADIIGFEENQVNVAHPTSRRETAPIIVKFVKKNDVMNFYHQRNKVYNL